jgi:hypothetical protein
VFLVCAGVFFVASLFFFALAIEHALSVVASILFLATVLIVRPYVTDRIDDHWRRTRGGLVERAVGEQLDALRYEGWIVMHGVPQGGMGDIDHIASGPNGVYLIETKDKGFAEEAQLAKARHQAAKLRDELGVWVSPVLCMNRRRKGPWKNGIVAIVAPAQLLDWLRSQRNPRVDPERLARFADSLD